MEPVLVIGAGLAGCEAAWQLARRDIPVILKEMKPHKMTPRPTIPSGLVSWCAPTPCAPTSWRTAVGLLKEELRRMGSLILTCADEHRVEAGGALAVDRHGLCPGHHEKIRSHPLITVVEEEVTAIPEEGNVIVASGPLTSDVLAEAIKGFFPESHYLNFCRRRRPSGHL